MTITIAIITRNRSAQLKRCLLSLTKQTVLPNEVLIVDNGSEDKTKAVVVSFQKRLPIQYVVEKQTGVPYARNTALSKARGQILAFIDDDCEAPPNWIKEILAAHKRYPTTIAIQGGSISLPRKSYISIITQFILNIGFASNSVHKHGKKLGLEKLTKTHFKLLFIDTKNASFKSGIIKGLHTLFDSSFHRYSSVDIAKRLLILKQDIIFCPNIKIYHWERATIKAFLIQRFSDGQGRAKLYRKWSQEYLPKLGRFWWVERAFQFFKYCMEGRYKSKLPGLIALFTIENIAFLLGYYWERFTSATK